MDWRVTKNFSMFGASYESVSRVAARPASDEMNITGAWSLATHPTRGGNAG
ncbi:hypothetical protein ARHIZOSPH14_10920 [Agromyces rhizosphaerae]|uniref:Uncharacterized protein n=1 Tax=Agromyces rhizosphaerae TaxID=88374 RepID=A0A9W6FNW3_9MICO|nr:hypothetical protein ARHIZOSPH14_10920 [Agromyces rhizosphaerae]